MFKCQYKFSSICLNKFTHFQPFINWNYFYQILTYILVSLSITSTEKEQTFVLGANFLTCGDSEILINRKVKLNETSCFNSGGIAFYLSYYF